MSAPITEGHFHSFGFIVAQHAKIEWGMRYYIAVHLDVPVYQVAIITAPYGARNFRNVIRALIDQDPLPEKQNEELKHLIGEFTRAGKLRNHIAHNLWTSGKREGSIKPMYARINEDRFDYYGHDDEEEDYLLEELEVEAKRLEKLHQRFVRFYEALGVNEHIQKYVTQISESK